MNGINELKCFNLISWKEKHCSHLDWCEFSHFAYLQKVHESRFTLVPSLLLCARSQTLAPFLSRFSHLSSSLARFLKAFYFASSFLLLHSALSASPWPTRSIERRAFRFPLCFQRRFLLLRLRRQKSWRSCSSRSLWIYIKKVFLLKAISQVSIEKCSLRDARRFVIGAWHPLSALIHTGAHYRIPCTHSRLVPSWNRH